jgi:hypothetical protein
VTDLRAAIDALRPRAGRTIDRDATQALRAIERGALTAREHLPGGDRAYVGLLVRVFRDAPPGTAARMRSGGGAAPRQSVERGSGLILP